MKRAAVFFDRDNTLIANDGYLGDPDNVVLVDGAAEAVARARALGFAVVVFSNQSGVARGMFSEEAVHAVNQRLDDMLLDDDARAVIDRHEFCPYHPQASVDRYRQDSDLRKPKPGMIFQAERRLALDLGRSWVVGDAPRDIDAGRAAGCRTILVAHAALAASPNSGGEGAGKPDFEVKSLREAIDVIEQNLTAAESAAAAPASEFGSPELAANEGHFSHETAAPLADEQLGVTDDAAGLGIAQALPTDAPTETKRAGGVRAYEREPAPGEPVETAQRADAASHGASPVGQRFTDEGPRRALSDDADGAAGVRTHEPEPAPGEPVETAQTADAASHATPPAGQQFTDEGRRRALPVEAADPRARAAPQPGSSGGTLRPKTRSEMLLEQILDELPRRHEQHPDVDFSVSKMMAGVVQIVALAAMLVAYIYHDRPDTAGLAVLVAIFLQVLTISLLIMGRQR